MHYLITGHTGFKGAWLVAWLHSLGHQVSGLALDPVPGALYSRARLDELMQVDARGDVRDAASTARVLERVKPDVVVHLAAQALVRESYRDPRGTWETNVMGTLNVLEAVGATPSVKAQLVITTDKVYRNVNQIWGYREHDALGGDDPYSASKAAADLLTQSWIATAVPRPPTAIARAGNVIGGGDVCADRLMVDLVTACSRGEHAPLRFPGAVRPWQHVLDCLAGYLTIIDHLLAGEADGQAYNIGPGADSFVTVESVAREVANLWGVPGEPVLSTEAHPGEAGLLALDPRKAELALGWRNLLPLHDALEWTVSWEKDVHSGSDPRERMQAQLTAFRARGGADRRSA
ncbi:CDP-glucose 4,6-dehydratase [Isoptericola sp. b441]|uniref:CDP-glucose 4,6-dehydratase n=1 Tax=Actinotalea lenta TaxID=3064654 RepID=A0ABT9DC70_9CELL|nr:CDP-glucose 4,6-dehydratase [Isoptericola sp. b441]MDO8108498.1 CDP-glucose 4,6-dehydratase [Isoptericola sp. b441]